MMARYLPTSLIIILSLGIGCSTVGEHDSGDNSHSVVTHSGIASAIESPANVLLWRDIPYAQPPTGELRWRAPRALEATTSHIKSGDGSVACLQQGSLTGGLASEEIGGTEDCLYLDVRAPAATSVEARPVMVWIHGGGNTSGYKGYYDFSALVKRQDVIVVTLNYRLGPLGWFTHPSIQTGQSGLDRSSNFGTLDIIQALQWVNNNVAAFGGDPDNITVFGESAGGHNIFALLSSPLAEGLFHKAIVQSGYVTSAQPSDAYNADTANSKITRSGWQLDRAVAEETQSTRLSAEQLRAVSGEDLLRSYYALDSIGYTPLTTADDVVIPAKGMLAALSDPKYAKLVPVIAGSNRDEVTLWLGLHRYFVDASYPFTRLLPPRLRLKDPDLYSYWVGVRSQAWKLRSVDQALAALEIAGYADLYAYRFDWDDQKNSFFVDFPTVIGAAHGMDISFITGDFRYGPVSGYVYPKSPERDQMQRTMMRAWAGFARTGAPDTATQQHWPKYSTSDRQFLLLDNDDNLRLESETQDLNGLLQQVASAARLDELQQCLLVWDSLTKVGDPDYLAYNAWNQEQCLTTDANEAQREINARLRQEHGSETVF